MGVAINTQTLCVQLVNKNKWPAIRVPLIHFHYPGLSRTASLSLKDLLRLINYIYPNTEQEVERHEETQRPE